MGSCWTKLGDDTKAIKCYEKAIELKEDYASPYNNIGACLRRQGKREEAITWFEKAIERKKDYSHAYNEMGLCLFELKRYEEAREKFRHLQAISQYCKNFQDFFTRHA